MSIDIEIEEIEEVPESEGTEEEEEETVSDLIAQNWRSLVKPKKVETSSSNSPFYGKFTIRPLERGYGTTIGNSLRRILLSSLCGAAITSVKFDGVLHEFSSIPGVVEDVTEIILNLKGVRIATDSEGPIKARIHATGKSNKVIEVTAGQLLFEGVAEVLNPDHHIATLTEGGTFNADIEVSIGPGGQATPFAKLEPVFVGGSTVGTATLHNADQVKEKDVRPGDLVVVRKAGDVIPEVLRPVISERPANTRPWEFPTSCPACKEQLERTEGEAATFCNNYECPRQIRGRIEHFVSRGAMDIEGFGEQRVDLFVSEGLINDVSDIFRRFF